MARDLVDKIKRYYGFARTEKKWLIISILAMTVIAGFNDGKEVFVAKDWLFNLFNVFLIVTLSILVRVSVQRIFGLGSGLKVEYKPSFHMIILGLIMAFMTMGKIIFLAPSVAKPHMLEKHRIGYFRYGLPYSTVGTISLMGPLASILLAVLFKSLSFLPSPLIEKVVLINVIFAISNILPLPGLDGLQLLFASRAAYTMAFGAIVGMSIFLLSPTFSLGIALLGAVIVGGLFCIAYFGFIQKALTGE